jgi:BolA protein
VKPAHDCATTEAGKILCADRVVLQDKTSGMKEQVVGRSDRAQAIEDALRAELEARHVAVIDQSSLHEGHSGAQRGGGHFQVLVVSERFRGLSRLAAQRIVYDALGDLMEHEIHALSMRTLTPEEWSA